MNQLTLKRMAFLVAFGLGAAGVFAEEPAAHTGPRHVSVEKTADGFRLRRDGKPYVIRGVGGRGRLDELVAAGGNSVRTWNANHLEGTLDEAEKRGLSVTVGLWLGHERHGFDYSDPKQVAADKERAREAVMRFKDHPAVLMWGIGNEMEANGQNPKVWAAINDIARMIKELDPNHPTMTVIAGTGDGKVGEFVKHCPDIDVLGVNGYGDLAYIPRELKAQGLDRPYVVTEFGPTGWWQVEKTSWGAEREPTSTEKAETYLAGYQTAVLDQPDRCLGAYAFLWGNKQEHTHTWFGMFLPTGERTAAVDVMTKVWTGDWPKNRCPAITDLRVQQATHDRPSAPLPEAIYPPGTPLIAKVEAKDPDDDPLTITWDLRPESTDKRSGGDPEQAPAPLPDAIVKARRNVVRVNLPEQAGAYRLFVYVTDGHNNAATANIPILVK
ncbi:MAG: hypothetical protein H6816_14665 [Phycisphaerales bacterium]|nr:hypothetical protein [Phycisphaerales bacterium]